MSRTETRFIVKRRANVPPYGWTVAASLPSIRDAVAMIEGFKREAPDVRVALLRSFNDGTPHEVELDSPELEAFVAAERLTMRSVPAVPLRMAHVARPDEWLVRLDLVAARRAAGLLDVLARTRADDLGELVDEEARRTASPALERALMALEHLVIVTGPVDNPRVRASREAALAALRTLGRTPNPIAHDPDLENA